MLGVVAEQTGYPPEMLDLELDLEADLGIDTVKQAETFAAIRELYGIERDDSLSLRDYPTLGSVVGFVRDRAPQVAPAPAGDQPVAPMSEQPVDAVPGTDLLHGDDDASAALPRRVVTAVPRPDLDRFVPTGIELGDDSRVIVMTDEGGVGKAVVKRLKKAGVDVLAIEDRPDVDDLLARIDEWRGDGPVQGLYWLPALDVAAPIAEMDLDTWHEELRVRVKLMYRTLRHLYEHLGEQGTFVVAGTRLGGRHGYDDQGAVDPLGGGVIGVTKSFKRERSGALVKAIDFPVSRKTAALADAIIAETERDPGAVEIGRIGDRRFAIGTALRDLPDSPAGVGLDSDSVFVVTGAAGSIVSAIVADLAAATHGTFHLFDLTPEPDRSDPDLAAFGADKEELKRTIFERLKADGKKATPVAVDKELATIERSHAALSAINAVEAAGGTVHYHSVNLLDAEGMAGAMDRVVETSGRVDVLLHAGGIEISKLLPDKDPKEFDLVFDIKADGWFHLMRGLREAPLGATVVFSSVAGRYGNTGQSDYSAANDLLCKMTSNLRTSRPGTTGLAFDWTAWGDIGMATRGSIPTVMKAAGIDMLPAAAGIPVIRRELTGDATTREQVVAQALGILTAEIAPDGGLDRSAISAGDHPLVPLSPASLDPSAGFVATVTLDPTAEPFLDDHRIDGPAVLPGVMGMETFATAARMPFGDRSIAGVEDVVFEAPFKFYRDEPRELRVVARYEPDGEDIVARCELVGVRQLANQEEPQITVHFRAVVRLSDNRSAPDAGDPPAAGDPPENAAVAEDIYRIYFHGPAYQVLDRVWLEGDRVIGLMAGDLPAEGSDADAESLLRPRLIELCFQTAGVWEIGTTGSMALPNHIDRAWTSAAEPEGQIRAVVAPGEGGAFTATVVDASGEVLTHLEGYRTIGLPVPLEDGLIGPLSAAMAGER